MKIRTHIYSVLFLLFFINSYSTAQAPPQGINYQAVAVDVDGKEIVGVDVNGQVIPNAEIAVRFTILDNAFIELYEEVHQTNTDRFGLFDLIIGYGTPTGGILDAFDEIDWGSGFHYLKVEIDIKGGNDFRDMGTQQMMSVPYALYTERAEIAGAIDWDIVLNDEEDLADVITYIVEEYGLNTDNQNLTLSNDTLYIERGNFVVLPDILSTVTQSIDSILLQGNNLDSIIIATTINNIDSILNQSNTIDSVIIFTNTQNIDSILSFSSSLDSIILNNIENSAYGIESATVIGDSLYLTMGDGTVINAGFVRGPQGDQGIQGLQGEQGIEGIQGLPGADGQDGVSVSSTEVLNDSLFVTLSNGQTINAGFVRGPQGDQGIQGPAGPTGATGPQGPIGADGNGIASTVDNGDGTFTFMYDDGSTFTTSDLTGPQGAQGNQGPTGATGPQGPAGADGQDGAQGPQGVAGPQGATGPQGPAGADGQDGAQGPQGLAGTNGVDGNDGLSAYEVWLGLGNTGTEADFVNSLTGPQGVAGPQGPAGADGQDGASGNAVPVGSIVSYAGNVVPSGWIVCDGSELSRVTYSALFNALGVSWGDGDGVTTFNLPDLRGRFLRGVDEGAGNDPNSASRTSLSTGGNTGDNVGSYQNDELKSHDHTIGYGRGNTSISTSQYKFDSVGGVNPTLLRTSLTGGSETRPKNAYVYFIIKSD